MGSLNDLVAASFDRPYSTTGEAESSKSSSMCVVVCRVSFYSVVEVVVVVLSRPMRGHSELCKTLPGQLLLLSVRVAGRAGRQGRLAATTAGGVHEESGPQF